MTLVLRVVSGARAGATERFDTPVVTVGRHPTSDLRFEPQQDLDVSARHAELRLVDGAWSVHDQGSTNGTFVNGERVAAERRVADGDTIAFGASGPVVEVRLLARADTRNAQDRKMLYEINAALDFAMHDDEVNGVIMAADGPLLYQGRSNLESDRPECRRAAPAIKTKNHPKPSPHHKPTRSVW